MRKCTEIVQDVREKRCYFAFVTTSTAETNKDKTFLLPDRIIFTVNAERFRCVEVLYQSSFIGKELCEIHDNFFSRASCSLDR